MRPNYSMNVASRTVSSECAEAGNIVYNFGWPSLLAIHPVGSTTIAKTRQFSGADHYGAGPAWRIPVWRVPVRRRSSVALFQFGAFQYGAVPGWRVEASS